jgi:hypothetical protein
MKRSIQRTLRIAFSAAMVGALVAMTAGVATAATSPKVTYNSIPKHVPGNVPSQPFQAQQTSEFGDSVTLRGTARHAASADIIMSSWGCESGNWDLGNCVTTPGLTFSLVITLRLYAVDPATGEPSGGALVTKPQSFAIPFRPSADSVNCTGADAGKWFSQADATCYNGFATKIKFTGLGGVVLPSNVIWTVAFNTSGYGADPQGYLTACAQTTAGCGYDSLNVGTQSFTGQPSAGTDVNPDEAVRRGLATDPLVLETGWAGYTPLATIRTR